MKQENEAMGFDEIDEQALAGAAGGAIKVEPAPKNPKRPTPQKPRRDYCPVPAPTSPTNPFPPPGKIYQA